MTLLAVLAGFGRTDAVPMTQGRFSAPLVIHLHGALAFAWVLPFLIRPLLVRWDGRDGTDASGGSGSRSRVAWR